MDQQLREWAEDHVGLGVEYDDQRWLVAEVRGGRAVLRGEDGLREVSLQSLRRRWLAENVPPREEERDDRDGG